MICSNYWTPIRQRRVARRRALAATGATALGAGLLMACGGDGGKGGGQEGQEESSGLLTRPVDSTKEANRNGTIKDRHFNDAPTLDVFTANNPLNGVSPHAYSTLIQIKPGYLKPSQGEVIGDLAESWEWSPDGLGIVMKLREGVTWHNKPPVSGRLLDMEDVLFSWERFATKHSARFGIANSANPEAPFLSVMATDSKTVVFKLKEPIVYGPALVTSNSSGQLNILPKETDSSFDIRTDVIGTGPYMLTNYVPSVSFTFERHPGYWDKDYALASKIELPIISEYASALSQLKAGNIYSMGSYRSTPKVTPEDILPVKREQPKLLLYEDELGTPRAFGARVMSFGWLPDGKSPFLDERVRQAISMSIDRDLWLDVVFNVTNYAAEGLPVQTRWNTHLVATQEGWWLDPASKDFGSNAKYFKHDLAEAKKLLSAAGYPDGFETSSSYVTSGQLPTEKHAEIMDGMIRELGITAKVNGLDYFKDYVPNYRDGHGQYEGWAYMSTAGAPTGGDPVAQLANQFWSKGGAPSFSGFSTSGKNDQSGDPKLDAMLEKARVELDSKKRQGLVADIQRHLGKAMYALQPPGVGAQFTVAWPSLRNFAAFQGSRLNYRIWVDETKPPFSA